MNLSDLHLGAHEGTGPSGDLLAPDEAGPLDGITNGLKLWADIGLTLGKQAEEQRRMTDRLLKRLEKNTPVDYGVATSGVFPAAGNLVLALGTPDQGTYWDVEAVCVGGTDLNVAAAGTAGLYVVASPPLPGAPSPGMINLADRSTGLPNVAFYGRRDVIVNDQEYLLLVVFGGTVGQQYVANASLSVFNVAAARGSVTTDT
jgi:hypothetical protein